MRRGARVGLRRITVAAALLAALLVPVAAADNNAPDHFMFGAVPAHGPHVPPVPAGGPPGPGGLPGPAAGRSAGTSNLTYHGGPVMRTNTVYTIFWSPGGTAISSTYENIIKGFFQNVATADGSSNNVYASDTQYSDGTGAIAYNSTFGGSYEDQSPIPSNSSCLKQYQSAGMTVTGGCVLDSDVENEVANAVAQNHWPTGGNSLFLVFTPKDVGSCFSASGNTCAYNYYCAYHSDFSAGGNTYLYANQPYTDSSDVVAGGSQVCSVGQFPNGDFADATINVASHEHNEAITDPYGTAWYDAQGNENGDKCAWTFGNALGTAANGSLYNQSIGTGKYYLQQEWSNASSSCVLTYAPSPPPSPPPTVTGASPNPAAIGTPVTITGTNLANATSVNFSGTSATFTASSDGTSIATTVPTGAAAGTGTLAVTTPGGTASSSFTVIAPDFTIGVTPSGQTVRRGSSTTYTVTIGSNNGFSGSVKLSVSGLPSGASASFSPSTVTGGSGTSTLTVSTRWNTRTGSRTLTITGTSGTTTHSTPASITVTN